MDIDPRTNVVVFQLRRGREKHLIERVPTLAEDGVRQAWDAIGQAYNARAKHVVALHSEWEPTPADTAFIAATFPGATVTHNFGRPGKDGWDDAFASAGDAILAAVVETPHGELLPVLWSESSPRASELAAVPHWPVAAGRLHLALAVVALGTHHVTHRQLGGQSFDELMADACRSRTADLSIDGRDTDDGRLLTMAGRLVAATACLPDFYQRLSTLANAERLIVGLPGPDDLLVAAAGDPMADVVERAVHESEHPTTELVPCVLSIAGDHIEVVFERAPLDGHDGPGAGSGM